MLIKASNLNVTKQRKHILQDISLRIDTNDFVTIIGPNGAGKSMLLKCLMDLYKPTSGTLIHSQDLRIGYVPQRFVPDIAIPISTRTFIDLNHKKHPKHFNTVVDITSIGTFLDTPLSQLSGGELQRVLLARALLKRPNLLILDEPAQNLDISGQLSFYNLLEDIYKNLDLSILMVSHDLHLVMSCTKKVICLFHHICCQGEPQMVTKDPEFISLFGKDMAQMMAVYHHSHNHKHEEHCCDG